MPLPSAYTTRADDFFERYENQPADDIRMLLTRWVPSGSRVLELGCGSGRDARFMAGLGAEVTATDGSDALLALAKAKADAQPETLSPGSLRFETFEMPPSPDTPEPFADNTFDVLYACGMLQHLTDHELYETAAFMERKTAAHGTLIILVPLDHKGEPDRPTYTREALDYITVFERMGFRLAVRESRAAVGSAGFTCRWETLIFLRRQESDESSRKLRRIVERDAKTSTYKLALLRALCTVNRTMPRAVRFRHEADGRDLALIPFGLIAECWVRDYWQLASGGRMPMQIHQNRQLGFATSLDAVMADCNGQYGLFLSQLSDKERPTDATDKLRRLFDDIATTAGKGPLNYITNEAGERLFKLEPVGRRRPALTDRLSLMPRYGMLAFPAELWLELNHIAPWFEDSIVLEWARVSARFEALTPHEKPFTVGDVVARLLPPESGRDVKFARDRYLAILATEPLLSVWSGKYLTAETLAVDHMLPWARFHSNDLWNLMPAHAVENARKSDAIPSADALYASRGRIFDNWTLMHNAAGSRFSAEAEIALTRTPLPQKAWEVPLFDALLETADMAARQLQAVRWP